MKYFAHALTHCVSLVPRLFSQLHAVTGVRQIPVVHLGEICHILFAE